MPKAWYQAWENLVLEKECKSKLQWDITSRWLEWSPSKSLQIINAGEGVEEELSCADGGNANWCSHYGEHYGGPSEN